MKSQGILKWILSEYVALSLGSLTLPIKPWGSKLYSPDNQDIPEAYHGKNFKSSFNSETIMGKTLSLPLIVKPFWENFKSSFNSKTIIGKSLSLPLAVKPLWENL